MSTKDQADSIIEQAKLLTEEDVSRETRIRAARKIMEHARAIKAVCMADPAKPDWYSEPMTIKKPDGKEIHAKVTVNESTAAMLNESSGTAYENAKGLIAEGMAKACDEHFLALAGKGDGPTLYIPKNYG